MALSAEGRKIRQIAEGPDVSDSTGMVRRGCGAEKMGVGSVAELIRLYGLAVDALL